MIKIKLNEKETNEAFKNYDENVEVENFIFNEYELITFKDGIKFIMIVKGDVIECREYETEFNYLVCVYKRNGDGKLEFISGDIDKISKCFNTVEEATRYLKYHITCFDNSLEAIKQYIMKKLDNRTIVIRSSKNYKTSNKHNKKVYKKKNIFLLDDVINYISAPRGTHNITCESWQVRGHYRRYKNGKVVFVRPYKKGKNRNKDVDRLYILGD